MSVPSATKPSHHRRQFIAVGIFLVIVIFFSTTFRMAVVRGDSMLPTYHDGQLLLVNKLRSINGPIQKGDVVLVGRDNDVIIKRVAYLPGDVIRGEDAFAFRRVKDFFEVSHPSEAPARFPLDGWQLKVPKGYYVLLGDNQAVSEDSRVFGPIAESDILGRVVNAVPKR
jgi:signal peptidase I